MKFLKNLIIVLSSFSFLAVCGCSSGSGDLVELVSCGAYLRLAEYILMVSVPSSDCGFMVQDSGFSITQIGCEISLGHCSCTVSPSGTVTGTKAGCEQTLPCSDDSGIVEGTVDSEGVRHFQVIYQGATYECSSFIPLSPKEFDTTCTASDGSSTCTFLSDVGIIIDRSK